ncbi:MAG: hypothetical protein JJU37_03950 [Balneolaceae bacterium]|nr:hypothetical protein [Balneolaceae bacterium]
MATQICNFNTAIEKILMFKPVMFPIQRILLSTFFLALFVSSGFAQISNPNGALKYSSPDDIWAKTLVGSHYNEFWTYHFYLNDGLTLHITFSVANFGSLKSPVSGVQVSVDGLDDNIYQLSREYNINHLVQDKENHMFRLRQERDIWFEGKLPEEHRIRINTSKDGVDYNIDLNMANILKGYKWGDGKFQIGNEEVGIITHIPYAEVSGYVDINGNRKNVTGSVYMDHTFQHQTTTRLVDSGFRFVHHQDSKNWDIVYLLLPDDSNEKKTIGYRLKSVDGKVSLLGVNNISEMSKSSVFGENVARIVDLNLSSSGDIRLTRMEDSEKFSVLSELNRFARRAARTFLGGEVIHFRGEGVLTETGQRPKQGHYNYFIVN